MGRYRESLGMRVFSLAMSVMLVMGLIPLSALAEVANEVAAGGDQPVVEAPLDEGAVSASTSGERPAEKEQPAQEEQPPGEGQPTDEGQLADEDQPTDQKQPAEKDQPANEPADSSKPLKDDGDPMVENETADAKKKADAKETASEEANKEDASKPAFAGEQVVDGVRVAVKAAEGVFPEGAKLIVEKATRDEEQQTDEAVEKVRDESENVAESHTFDVKVLGTDGKELQPSEGQKVEVSFTLAEVADKNLETQVYHVTEDEGTGEVTTAEVSNAELFSVSNQTGEWVLTVHRAFNTTEWMKVTVNGVTYEITVTDSEVLNVRYVERHWDGTSVVSEEKTHEATRFPRNSTVIPAGWYVVDGNITVDDRICLTGDTHLILANGNVDTPILPGGVLHVRGLYVPQGCTLNIYGQNMNTLDDMGQLWSIAEVGAGIGGYSGHVGGNVVVYGGGYIEASGGENGAGIGGGRNSDGGTITIFVSKSFQKLLHYERRTRELEHACNHRDPWYHDLRQQDHNHNQQQLGRRYC